MHERGRLENELDALYLIHRAAAVRLRAGDEGARLTLRVVDELMAERDAALLKDLDAAISAAVPDRSPQLEPSRGLTAGIGEAERPRPAKRF